METHTSCLELCNKSKDINELKTEAKDKVIVTQNPYAEGLLFFNGMVFQGDWVTQMAFSQMGLVFTFVAS